MGKMDYIFRLLGGYKERKQFQTVGKVNNALSNMKGVDSVDVNKKQNRVTVTGYVERGKVLRKVQATGKKAEIWPYIPHYLVAHPYSKEAYDKKAPGGYVRNVKAVTVFNYEESEEEKLAKMFSDENTNACSVM